MSKQYYMLNKKKELDLELKGAKDLLIKEKARCFKVLNGSKPYVPKFGPSGQKVLDEFDSLCEYYGIDPKSINIQEIQLNSTPSSPTAKSPRNSPSKDLKTAANQSGSGNCSNRNAIIDAYRIKMQKLLQEENSKRLLLAKLNQRLLVVQRQNDRLNNEKRSRVVTIDKSFNSLKNQLNASRDYFINFVNDIKSKLNAAKKIVNKVIVDKNQRNRAQIESLDMKIDQLQIQKNKLISDRDEKFSRLALQPMDDQNIDYIYNNEKLKAIILGSAQEVQKRFQERLNSLQNKPILKQTNDKVFEFSNNIDSLIQKINSLRAKRAERLSQTIISNWGSLAHSMLKLHRFQIALDEHLDDYKAQDKQLAQQLKQEMDLVNTKIPGTEFTLLEIRKEIIRLTDELTNCSKTKTEELKKIESEHSLLKAETSKIIEQLEAELNK